MPYEVKCLCKNAVEDVLSVDLTSHLQKQQAMDAESGQVLGVCVVDASHDHTEDGEKVHANYGGGEKKAIKVQWFGSGDGKFGDLKEANDGAHHRQAQDDHLGATADPKHLDLEVLLVLHDEEDDEDDDAAHQTQQAKEQALGGRSTINLWHSTGI